MNFKLPELERDEMLWLDFSIGMLPDSWNQSGDGVEFLVKVITDREEQVVFSQTIDPKNNPTDRKWHPFSVDLTQFAGQTVQIQFETTGRPSRR